MNQTPMIIRQRAYTTTAKAVSRGQLVKPETCENCSLPKTLVAHHRDYSNPHDVEWLCGSCHKKAHIAAGEVNYKGKVTRPKSTNGHKGGRPRGSEK